MKEADLERLLHCPPEQHGRRHRRAAPPIPPPLSAVRTPDSSPGNSGQRRSPPCRDREAGEVGRGGAIQPFLPAHQRPGTKRRSARGRAGASRPTPPCCERLQPCSGFFPGGAEGYTPLPRSGHWEATREGKADSEGQEPGRVRPDPHTF